MKQEDRLFLLGLMSLICSLFLFPFVAYLFPVVWLGWEYRIPHFVLDASLWIQTTFHTTYAVAFRWFFRLSFFAAIIFGVVAYLISHHISKLQEINELLQENGEHEKETKETKTEEVLAAEVPAEEVPAEKAFAEEAQAQKKTSVKISTRAKQNSKESVLFFLKMVVIITLVFIVSDMIQWAISFSPEAK